MIDYDTILEDEDLFEDFDDDFEDLFEDDDDTLEASDDLDERRRRRGRRRRAPRIRRPRTARGQGFVKRRPAKGAVSMATLQASLERVGKDIRTNATAIKSLGGQVKSATKKLNDENNRQNTSISSVRDDLKKHSSAAAQSNQLNMLLPLLQKSPELEARTPAGAALLGDLQIKKQDNTTALLIAMMAAQPTTGAGGAANNSMNMMLPLILLMDK